MVSRADDGTFVPAMTGCQNQSPDSPLRRVSSLQPVQHSDVPRTKAIRRVSSLEVLLNEQPASVERNIMRNGGQGLKVRFVIDTKEEDTSHAGGRSSTQLSNTCTQNGDPTQTKTKAGRTGFRDKFRASFQRHNTHFKEGEEETGTARQEDGGVVSKRREPTPTTVNNVADISSKSHDNCALNIQASEPDWTEDGALWVNICQNYHPYHFQRSQSTKSNVRSMPDEDDEETSDVARSVTEERFLSRSSFYMFRRLHLPAAPHYTYCGHSYKEAGNKDESFYPRDLRDFNGERCYISKVNPDRQTTVDSKDPDHLPNTMRQHITEKLGDLLGHGRWQSGPIAAVSQGASRRRLTGHSLASVELGSWAARGSKRNSSLSPFCAPLSPAETPSRGDILQTVSSAIIHLFQRKHLKENELGVLQEHVRFLIRSEAGGLVHEYYKEQLLRKGMIILREKIKNEQGMELLKQLCETWEYFFKEILPTLQAILYPLSDLMAQDETIRSLTLLAFRNIVVLKVSIKEALDSVEKRTYPASTQQMLLVLQSIQDNIFLSENQFLLEKLVARVVCPYLGQRGVYEGSPEPVIKVKLKPIPIIIPMAAVSENRLTTKSRQQFEHNTFPCPVSPWKVAPPDISSGTKLKPVLEHVYDVGRRHSIIS